MSAGRVADLAPRWWLRCSRPGCPRCGEHGLWVGWVQTTRRCPGCDLDVGRHGWAAAVWINSWFTAILLGAWIVGGLATWGLDSASRVRGGAVALAVLAPPALYPLAKGVMLRLLLRLDPPEEGAGRGW